MPLTKMGNALVQFLKFSGRVGDQRLDAWANVLGSAGQERAQRPLEDMTALVDAKAPFHQEGSSLVDQQVRLWIIRSRARCSACRSSCSAVLTETKLIVGRVAALAIASASRSSFLCTLT